MSCVAQEGEALKIANRNEKHSSKEQIENDELIGKEN